MGEKTGRGYRKSKGGYREGEERKREEGESSEIYQVKEGQPCRIQKRRE